MSPAVITLIVLAIAVVVFFNEKFPLGINAMFAATVLYFAGVYDAATVYKNFVNSNVLMFVGMFIIGGCMFSTGVADKIGHTIAKYSKSERQFMIAAYLVCAALSVCLTNVGTVVVLMPVVISTCLVAGYSTSRMIMTLAIAAIMGGNCSLIGTAPPAIAKAALEAAYPEATTFSFFEWAYAGLPMTIAVLVFLVLGGYKLLPDTPLNECMVQMTSKVYSNVPAWKGKATVAMLIVCVILMCAETFTGIPLYVVSMTCGFLMVAFKICTLKESIEMVEWNTLMLLAGMLSVAAAMSSSGAGAMIADALIGLVGNSASGMVYFFLFFCVTAVLTQFMSNTAATSLMTPISIEICSIIGINPRGVLMAVVMGASMAFLTPVGSPPVTVASGPANYRFQDFPKWGLPIILICMVICAVVVPIVWPF